MEKTVVIFTPTNARIIRNPSDDALAEFIKWPNVVIDPDLSKVSGVAPHYWKLIDGGQIVPMSYNEEVARQAQIESSGIDNSIYSKKIEFKKQMLRLHHIDYIVYGVIIALEFLILIFKK